MKPSVIEKSHRLPREYYKGSSFVSLTICIQDKVKFFDNIDIVNVFIEFLRETTEKFKCKIPVYCFMPDHLHIIMTGIDEDVDLLKAAAYFKQKTGFWLGKNKRGVSWQKDFYDHVLKKKESLSIHVKYILDNPVRKGLVDNWMDHPFKGAIGYNLEDVLAGLI